MDNWRLLSYKTTSASANMAIDEALLEAHIAKLIPPTLRLYGFAPQAISIGHNQPITDTILENAAKYGIDIVRRPTGGRAVLHVNDLTYSFICSSNSAAIGSSISTSYQKICQALQHAFQTLGLKLEMGSRQAKYKKWQDCFKTTSFGDLQIKGKKIIGSAQLRRKEALLQHGSILLNQVQNLMPEILGEGANLNETNSRHINLFDAAQKEFAIVDLEDAIKLGFESVFAIKLTEDQLTSFEKDLASSLELNYPSLNSVQIVAQKQHQQFGFVSAD